MLSLATCCSGLGGAAASTVAAVLQVALGTVWVLAAVGKARAPLATRATVQRLFGGSGVGTTIISRGAVPVELVLGAALILRWHAQAAAAASTVLFLVFAFALGRAAVREALPAGPPAPAPGGCGCFGAPVRAQVAFTASDPGDPTADPSAGARAVARNLVFAAIAVAAAFGG